MNQTRWNVDCGCLVFQYLAISEAIALSRTNYFWYEISGRRSAYQRMKFPSFTAEFDILEYRHWQGYGRQKLALTPVQLIHFSYSRVIANGITDLELILDESPFDLPDPANDPTTQLSMSTEEVLVNAISRYQSVVALTITIEPKFGESLTSREMQWKCVNCFISHLAHRLISFQLLVSQDSLFGFNMAYGLSTTHANLSMPNLLHVRMPLLWTIIFGGSDHEAWSERWAPLGPFQPKGGLLELSSLLYFDGTHLSTFYYADPWEMINPSLEGMVHPPAHLICSYPHLDGRPSSISRSLGIVIPARFQAPDADVSPEKYWSDHIPIDSHYYQEVDFKVVNTDGQEDVTLKDFAPLRRRLAHSVRSLNIDFDEGPPYNRSYIGFRLLMMRDTYSNTVLSALTDETDYLAAVAESPFIHVTRVRITEHCPINVDLSHMPRICPSLTHLELIGPVRIAFGPDNFPFQQLRHLTTPVAYHASVTHTSHNYMWRIVSQLRQLETLHLLLVSTHMLAISDHCLNLLVLSSKSLTEVILSYDLQSSEMWLTNRNDQRESFNQWLIELHLIWQKIQPTHTLPLDQISLAPITCMVDLVPLLATFIRHPTYRLPYLRHRCREYDCRSYSAPQPSLIRRLTSAITSIVKGWFQMSGTNDKQADARTLNGVHRAVTHPEDLIQQKRAELADHLAREQTRMKVSKEAEFPTNVHMHRLRIEPRTHFRIVIQ